MQPIKPKIKKLFKLRVHWFVTLVISLVLIIMVALPVSSLVIVNVFAGVPVMMVPMSTCSNYFTCGACELCGCGTWDQIIIAPLFGIEPRSKYWVCRMPSFVPDGDGDMMIGSVVFGYGASYYLSVNDHTMTFIKSNFQL